jgi:hypothetical protein
MRPILEFTAGIASVVATNAAMRVGAPFSWIAPPLPGQRWGQAITGPSPRACARAGSVFATPLGNHGGNV